MVVVKEKEKTFQYQSLLPKLPVPDLNKTLDSYLASACVLLSEEEKKNTQEAVEEFRKSKLAEQLNQALLQRAATSNNWLDEWWYDAYCEIREPLIPYLSVASIQPRSPAAPGMQLHRAADATHHLMQVWMSIRREEYPVMRSRGVVWDMNQNYVLFNSSRVPALPKDRMERYFRTENDGPCPSNIVVLCRGNFWNLEMLKDGQLRSPDELFHCFDYIQKNSPHNSHCIATMTAEHRDKWARTREHLITLSMRNAGNVHLIESSAFIVTLIDDVIEDENELLVYSMMGRSENQWADKSLILHSMGDGQISTQADHSNVDAIVILEAGNTSGRHIRLDKWHPEKCADLQLPQKLEFDYDTSIILAINKAEETFQQNKARIDADVVRFNGYGAQYLRQIKIYGDTVIQLAMQLAYAKTHGGDFAPIYETSSTRKFFHGRTETVRGRTQAMVDFGQALLRNAPIETQRTLFKKAYDDHNKLMAEATEGQGFDRHLYGLRKVLEQFNKGQCGPKFALPRIFTDKAWKHSGGDGNFKLSTSFIGYDSGGSYGYVCAMCPDGYGTFYKINTDSILLTTTNYKNEITKLKEYGRNIQWALGHLGTLFAEHNAKL